jgi:peroxin-19
LYIRGIEIWDNYPDFRSDTALIEISFCFLCGLTEFYMATQQELDDLDDLDGPLLRFILLILDILDDFDTTDAKPGGEKESQAPKSSASTAVEPDFSEDEFARQLQLGMEQLMREMESSPAVRNEFESLVKSMADATAGAPAAKSSFSETLSRTMERIQESESAADKARDEASQSETDAFLADMLKQLDAAGGGDGVGDEAGMATLLEGMMEQLMSKEILYEPMKDLKEKVRIILDIC